MNKSRMRAEARARLANMSEPEVAEAADRIARSVWNVPEVAGARVMLLYASTAAEVDTDAIAGEAERRGILLTYPRCLPETRAMVLHKVDLARDLRDSGLFGIREPDPACPLVDLADIDVALVPGLAWDRRGTRLGRGEGYYDRLFSNPAWRGFRCGLFFSAQEFGRLPANRFDAPLDAVVTDKEVVRFATRTDGRAG